VTLFTLSAFAQDLKTEIAKCASIENSVERLTAYDALAKDLGVAEPAILKTEDHGKWALRTSVSPIDDSKIYIFSLTANEFLSVGHKSITPILTARYNDGNLEIFISYNDLFIGTDSTQVTSRFDKEEALTIAWAISTDHETVFMPLTNFSKLQGPMMKGAKTLVVRLTPYGESPVTSSFDIAGFDEASGPIVLEDAKKLAKEYDAIKNK